jgi:hypothetical protein
VDHDEVLVDHEVLHAVHKEALVVRVEAPWTLSSD